MGTGGTLTLLEAIHTESYHNLTIPTYMLQKYNQIISNLPVNFAPGLIFIYYMKGNIQNNNFQSNYIKLHVCISGLSSVPSPPLFLLNFLYVCMLCPQKVFKEKESSGEDEEGEAPS